MKGHGEDEGFRVVTLKIDGVNIDRLPLDDIGAYITDFAELLGRDVEPRYHSIRRGSLILKAKVRAEREIDIKTRGFQLRTGDAPEDAVRARERMSRRLGIHHAKRATLLDSTDAKVVEIPVERPLPEQPEIPSLIKAGSLQGKIIRIGGKQETVSVELQDADGHVYLCRARRDLAKRLAREMFDPTVRVYGSGRWARGDDGTWYVNDFQIARFDVLEDDKLSEVIDEIRKIPSDWKSLDDPDAELETIRKGEPPKT